MSLMLAQGAVWVCIWCLENDWILGVIGPLYIVAAVALAKGRVAFPIVVQGLLTFLFGWVFWEAVSLVAHDCTEQVYLLGLPVIGAIVLMGVLVLFFMQTRNALDWFARFARTQGNERAEKIKRGVWTVLVADILLLAFIACLDVDAAVWFKRSSYLEDVIGIEDDDFDLCLVITSIFGIPLDTKVNANIWAKMYGIEHVEGAHCSRTFSACDSVAFGIPGPWEVTEQINTTNGYVEVVSATHAPIGYEAVSNLFETVGERFWDAFDAESRLAEGGSPPRPCSNAWVGKWSDHVQTVEIVADDQSLRLVVRREE